jgi:lipopolysaccharide heptosyltransferase II
VIATRVGGVLDIIEDGKNGMLVPAGDIEAMADAMAVLLQDPQRSAAYAERLQEKVANQFTLTQMAENNIAVYDEVRRSRKILVIKLGAIGDLILIVPSLRMLRTRFPEAFISLLVDKKIAPIVSNLPYVNEIVPIDRKKFPNLFYLLKLAKKIRKDEFDVSIDFQNSKWTHLLAFVSGIQQRYGFERGKLGFLLNRPDHTFDAREAPVKHQFRILSKLGVRELDERLELWPDPESENKMGRILDDFKKDSSTRLVGLVVGSSPNWPTKRWPIDNFKRLAERLSRDCGAQIVLIGSPEDIRLGEGFESGREKEILNLLGKTSHRDLISLFKRLSAVVTGDTAPLHVAAAMQTRIVALFGPTDPKRHMPTRDGATVLCRALPCEPCYSGTCRIKDKLACLTQISVQEVFEAVQRQLGAAS